MNVIFNHEPHKPTRTEEEFRTESPRPRRNLFPPHPESHLKIYDKHHIFQAKTAFPCSINVEDAMGQIVTELEKLNKKADVIIGILLTPEKSMLR